jgi:cation transport protein ChaC
MWVFGYGSLMWDNWEQQQACISKKIATLSGYQRSFNKPSRRNWGTPQQPGPTLNLIKAKGKVCRGMAFQFEDERRGELLAYLGQREGRGFEFPELRIRFCISSRAVALVPIYRGQDVIAKPPGEIALMAISANGDSGRCSEYILNIDEKLRSLSIRDEAVEELAEMIRS